MNSLNNNEAAKNEASQYATGTYFCHVFIEDMADLHQLSFLLTADYDKAEHCVVAGLGDCLKANNVFREWASPWAKRSIVQQAIRELQPHPDITRSYPIGQSQNWETGSLGDFELYRVLGLEDFERFVFVMSVLENYPEHDCALLLRCSLQDIRRARVRALEQLVRSHLTSFAHDSFTNLQEMNT